MSLQVTLGLFSTIALFAPVAVLTIFRMVRYRPYIALFVYCLMSFLYSLMTMNYVHVPGNFEYYYGLSNNLFDVPLMMIFLAIFAKSKSQKKRMQIFAGIYVVYEIVVLLVMQKLTKDTIALTMGPGLAMMLYYCFSFFIHRVRIFTSYQKAAGKAIIISSILFAYVCFSFIYVVHYLLQLKNIDDTFLIYFLVSIVFNLTLATGLTVEHYRLKKFEETQLARRELAEVFSADRIRRKKAASREETADFWKMIH